MLSLSWFLIVFMFHLLELSFYLFLPNPLSIHCKIFLGQEVSSLAEPPLRVLFSPSLSFCPAVAGGFRNFVFILCPAVAGGFRKFTFVSCPAVAGGCKNPVVGPSRRCGPASFLGGHITVSGASLSSCRRETNSALAAVAVQ